MGRLREVPCPEIFFCVEEYGVQVNVIYPRVKGERGVYL